MRRMLAVALMAVAACGRNDDPVGTPVRDVAVSARVSTLLVGATTPLTALVTGTDGSPLANVPVSWTSLTPSVLSVSSSGIATALQPGQGTVRAVAGNRSGDVSITVKNPPVAAIAFDRDSAIITLPAGSVTLVPGARDAVGRPISNPTFFFSTDAPKVASVSQLGVVTALAAGVASISASADGAVATVRVRVTANVTTTSPRITTVAPLVVGATATITGSNFAPSIGGNAVLVEGIPVTITAASTTQLTVTLPTAGWRCSSERPVSLQVNANNEIGVATATLRTAIARPLAVGQSLLLSGSGESRCNELPVTGGSYLVTVYHPARATGNETSFQLLGVAATSRATDATANPSRAVAAVRSARVTASPPTYPALGSARLGRWIERSREAQRNAAHARLLERSADFVRAAGAPGAALRRWRSSTEGAARTAGAAANQVATLGAITPLRIPNLDAPGAFCSAYLSVGARTAYVGQRVVIVEDTTTVFNGVPTLKGTLDSLYARVGQEFDSVMWPILTQSFGNPLAMDQQLSRLGKVVMFFSPRINAMAGGAIEGFVASCDFYPTSQAASSNVGQYFYAVMPTSTASGMNAGTRDGWHYSIRSTIIHEAKHIVSYAERIARNTPGEESWLEEGLARHAEEQFARRVYRVGWKGNVDYRASVYCDVRPASPSAPQCAGTPLLMRRHFDDLYDYLRLPENYTVLGRISPTDASFYATSWSVARWMADHYAADESAFLSALVQSNLTGVANLEARTGRGWDEMFGEWALTLFTDDYPGVTFSNPRLRFPSWNLRDQFKGMCVDFGPCGGSGTSTLFPLEFPLVPHPVAYGNFAEQVPYMNSGTFAAWLLSGPQAVPQILDLRSASGGEAPVQLRLAIVRVQ